MQANSPEENRMEISADTEANKFPGTFYDRQNNGPQ